MDYKIIHLPKEQWQNYVLPFSYTTEEYYDIQIDQEKECFTIKMERKRFEKTIVRTSKEDFLYAEWWPDACAWGIIEEEKLVAVIETCPEKWSNRLRINELWVDANYQKQGIGRALMEIAKEQARLERRRAVILETQSCNVNAIDFYLHEGFTLIGMDTCCYSNADISQKHVRIEMGWFV